MTSRPSSGPSSDNSLDGTVCPNLHKTVDATPDEGDACDTGSDVAIIRYDALGRRISKQIVNSADWNCTYHYYYDGQRMIETRNVNNQVLKQHVWGLTYVDELVQIGINQDPGNASAGTYTENLCERFIWGLQDANFNVIGVVNHAGLLLERYEYTPYGQRTVFSRDYLLCDINGDGAVDFIDYAIFGMGFTWPDHPFDFDGDGFVEKEEGQDDRLILQADKDAGPSSTADALVSYPRLESSRGWSSSALMPLATGICDVGHQGLHLDKEFGLYYNRARYHHPRLGRFIQRDPSGYADGMNRFEYVRSNPAGYLDPSGLVGQPPCMTPQEVQEKIDEVENNVAAANQRFVNAAKKALGEGKNIGKAAPEEYERYMAAKRNLEWWQQRQLRSCSRQQEQQQARLGVVLDVWASRVPKPERFEKNLRAVNQIVDNLLALNDLADKGDKAPFSSPGPGPTGYPGLTQLPYFGDASKKILSAIRDKIVSVDTTRMTGDVYYVHVLVQCFQCKCEERGADRHWIREWTPTTKDPESHNLDFDGRAAIVIEDDRTRSALMRTKANALAKKVCGVK